MGLPRKRACYISVSRSTMSSSQKSARKPSGWVQGRVSPQRQARWWCRCLCKITPISNLNSSNHNQTKVINNNNDKTDLTDHEIQAIAQSFSLGFLDSTLFNLPSNDTRGSDLIPVAQQYWKGDIGRFLGDGGLLPSSSVPSSSFAQISFKSRDGIFTPYKSTINPKHFFFNLDESFRFYCCWLVNVVSCLLYPPLRYFIVIPISGAWRAIKSF